MTANLFVSLSRRCAFGITGPFQDGILAKTLLDFDQGFLDSALFLFVFLLFEDGIVIGEKVELSRAVVCCLLSVAFCNDVIRRYVQATD